MFSEKATPVRKDPIQDKDPAVRQEGNILTKSAEKTRRRIRLEGKKELPSLRDAFDAYVKAKTLTWSAASAKDIPPQGSPVRGNCEGVGAWSGYLRG